MVAIFPTVCCLGALDDRPESTKYVGTDNGIANFGFDGGSSRR